MNLTPHTVSIHNQHHTVTVPPSGQVARVNTQSTYHSLIHTQHGNPVQLFTQRFGEVTGLPEPAPGTLYVVSLAVRQALPHRLDLASPGELVRDQNGQPVGCKGLVINSQPLPGTREGV